MLKLSLIASAVAVVLLVMACKGDDKQPLVLPTSVPVAALYQQLHAEKELNPTRMEAQVDQRVLMAFHGNITKIEDSKVQFHLEVRPIVGDLYVECKFAKKILFCR